MGDDSKVWNAAVALAMQARITDLVGYWLEVACCGGATVLPLRQMAQKRGQQPLCEILPLLACKRCGGSAAHVWLNETFNRTDISKGAAPGWSIRLVPPPVLGVHPSDPKA